MKLPEVKKGNAFKFKLNKQDEAIVQCVKVGERDEADTIRVMPKYIKGKEYKGFLKEKELFFNHMPISYLIKDGTLTFIGNYKIPKESKAPKYYRSERIIGNKFICWYIVNSKNHKVQCVKKLNKEQLKMSKWDHMSLPYLIEKIETNWTPEQWN